MFNYALILFEGKVTAVDETEAGRYFKMAADKGQAKAMYAYGVMLYKWISVPINETEASRYFKMASDYGNLEGMVQYGNALFQGEGIDQKSQKLSNFLRKLHIKEIWKQR